MASAAPFPLVPDPTCFRLDQREASSSTITVIVTTTAAKAPCPVCQNLSEHVHSRSMRRVADLPWMGWDVKRELHTRRFFCLNLACERQIFAERLPSAVEPYAHRPRRLTDVLPLIGFALGGEAGKRLAGGMGLPTSPDTLLRLMRAEVEKPAPTPRVPGVDDFSLCRRKTYGTTLIDLERRGPLEILSDREAAALATWLKARRAHRDYQPGSGRPLRGRCQARSASRPAGCRPLACVSESFRGVEAFL